MKKRQILACLLAASCAASLSVNAFAAADITLPEMTVATDETDVEHLNDWQLDVDTEVQKPTLKVTLPSSTSVLVNPYRIEIKTGTDTTSFDTILSPEMEIENKSGCAIKVSVKGSVQAYSLVKDFNKGEATEFEGNNALTANAADYELDISKLPDVGKVYLGGGSLAEWDATGGKVVAQKTPVIVDENGRILTATVTAPTFATADKDDVHKGDVTKAGKVVVTAYTASKDIKVATSAFVADTDKSNSLFIYAEGRQEDGDWASAYKLTAAGAKDSKGVMTSTTGMVALAAKETTGAILYLGANQKGYARITGVASTAPTNSWVTVIANSPIETPIAFVIDAVANEAPKGPELKNIKFANVKPTADGNVSDAITPNGKTVFTGLTWTVAAAATQKAKVTANMQDAEGSVEAKKTSYTSSNTAVITVTEETGEYTLNAVSNGKATITATYTAANGGKTVYTFEITVSGIA